MTKNEFFSFERKENEKRNNLSGIRPPLNKLIRFCSSHIFFIICFSVIGCSSEEARPAEKDCEVAGCPAGQICQDGACVADPSADTCEAPACSEDGRQFCEDGRWVDCGADAICQGGACVADPSASTCEAPACSEDGRRFCEDGRWADCGADAICQAGACIATGTEPECAAPACSPDGAQFCADGKWQMCAGGQVCADGACVDCAGATCAEDGKRQCVDGKWQACGEGEICLAGACVDTSCTAPSCSADGASACVGGAWQVCAGGTSCDVASGACQPRSEADALGYVLCRVNSHCSSGVCLKELVLSRPDLRDDGRTRIALHELDSRIAEGEGVCSQDCTSKADICGAGQTCQVVHGGASPYPDAPSLPIAGLDLGEMAERLPFAAMCRPALETLPLFGEKFCQSCAQADECGDLFCERDTLRPASGVCLKRCSADAHCPIGFACAPSLADGSTSVCRPIAGTCGSCLDRDTDGQGLGHCLSAGVDCNDADADILFSASLPGVCAEAADINCNGRDDKAELLGSAAHCTDCNDSCTGEVEGFVNGSKQCEQSAGTASGYLCATGCAQGYGDCNGDLARPDSDGCEHRFAEADMWAPDRDRDGHGDLDPAQAIFCCPASAGDPATCYEDDVEFEWVRTAKDASVAWISQQTGKIDDCDDADPQKYPGHAEVCDGKDNDCNGTLDDADTVTGTLDGVPGIRPGSACRTAATGACGEGTAVCDSENAPFFYCQPNHPGGTPEVCDGKDNNCDGLIDNGVPSVGEACSLKPEDHPEVMGECRKGQFKCGSYQDETLGRLYLTGEGEPPLTGEDGNFLGVYCDLNAPAEYDFYATGLDENCDGFLGDLTHGVFVAPADESTCSGSDETGDGSSQKPYATLQKALDNNCKKDRGQYKCQDIYLSSKINETSNKSLNVWVFPDTMLHEINTKQYQIDGQELPQRLPLVRIHGGMTVSCSKGVSTWSENTKGDQSKWTLIPNFSNASTRAVAAITGANRYSDRPLSLLLDSMAIKVESVASANADGVTSIGIACPKGAGCTMLTLDNTAIDVSAATGKQAEDYSAPAENIHPDSDQIPGYGIFITRSPMIVAGINTYAVAYESEQNQIHNTQNNKCLNKYIPVQELSEFTYNSHTYVHQPGGTSIWKKYSNADFQKSCPDGARPHGGCGGLLSGRMVSPPPHLQIEFTLIESGPGYSGSNGLLGGQTSADQGLPGAPGQEGRGGSPQSVSLTLSTTGTLPYVDSRASIGAGSHGGSGSGGAGGHPTDKIAGGFLLGPMGGQGGCGGAGGRAGGTGGSAIGIVMLSPPNNAETKGILTILQGSSTPGITVTGGQGGQGGKGQDGNAGGPSIAKLTREDSNNNTTYTVVTASGAGGAGGGGGGGAGGHGGHAYGVMFACGRGLSLSGYAGLERCGIEVGNTALIDNPNAYIRVKAGKGLPAGKAGTAGSWSPTASGQPTSSVGGKGGAGGSQTSTSGSSVNDGEARQFFYTSF